MRDHLLFEKFFDYHARGPFTDHFGPHGCRPHCHRPRHGPHHHGHGPHHHGHGPHHHGHGRWGHGPYRHGHHGPHAHNFHFDGPHREFAFFGPRDKRENPCNWFRDFDGPKRHGRFDRAGGPGPSFFRRGDIPDRRGECPFGRRGHRGGRNPEEQTFLFRGVVIEQDKDKRPNSV